MKIEFALTLDDFLEWQDHRFHPSKSRTPISLIAGFLLIAFGYAVLRWHPEGGAFTGGVALFLGLFATFPAAPMEFLLSFLLRRRRAQKQRSSLQSEFERFYSEQRVLEADESGWRISVGSAENRRQWADLFSMAEGSRVLTLADSFASCPLRKSAFPDHELDSLRKLGRQALVPASPLFSVSVTPTPMEYASAMVAHDWHQRTATMLARYAAGLLAGCFVALVIADAWPGLGLPTLLLLAILMPATERQYYRWRFPDYRLRAFQAAMISKDSICFHTGTLDAATEIRKISYRWISEVRETRHTLMLYVHPALFYMIPKASLRPAELAQLRQLLQNRAAKPD